jgi:phosphomannomutase
MSLMVSVSGIRGVFGKDLTPPVILKYVCAFVHVIKARKNTILIGRDTRESGEIIEHLIQGTLAALGVDTITIGIVPTPTVLFMTRKLHCIGGIAITASHNPSQWNALKFCNEKGLFLEENAIKKMAEYVHKNHISPRLWQDSQDLGKYRADMNAYLQHADSVIQCIDHDSIKKQGFRVAIDPGGGAGSGIDRYFLEALGCSVVSIHDRMKEESRGIYFPRGPEPVPENLSLLCGLVTAEKAHIGFAQDPDADRLAVVSEKGIAIGEEYTLMLAGEAYLRRKKTDMVCNMSTSMMMDDLAQKHSVKLMRSKIGEAHVTSKLLQHNLFYGGEGNGGVIAPEINPCRDSIVAMGLILSLLAHERKPLSTLVSEIPSYVMRKEKIQLSMQNTTSSFTEVKSHLKKVFPKHSINILDGIKIYNKKEWLHIRPSNTEPIFRIIAESQTKKRTKFLVDTGMKIIKNVFL